jgi:hypothetical protein
VAFTKVLTMYQLEFNPFTALLYPSFLSPLSPIPRTVSAGIIFAFTYMYTQFLQHIHPPTPFSHHLPLILVPSPLPLGRTCSTLLYFDLERKKKR